MAQYLKEKPKSKARLVNPGPKNPSGIKPGSSGQPPEPAGPEDAAADRPATDQASGPVADQAREKAGKD